MRKPRAAGYPGRPCLEPLEDRRLLSSIVGPVQPAIPVVQVVRTSLVGPLSPAEGGGETTIGLDGPGIATGRDWSAERSMAFTPPGMMGPGRGWSVIGPQASAESIAVIGSQAATESVAAAGSQASTVPTMPPIFSARPWVGGGWGWQGGNRSWQKSEDAAGNEALGPGASNWSSSQPQGGFSFRGLSRDDASPQMQMQRQGQGPGQQAEAFSQHPHEGIGGQMFPIGMGALNGNPQPPGMMPPPVMQGRSGEPTPPPAVGGVQALPPTAAPASSLKEEGSRLTLSITDVVARGGALELTAGLQPALLLSNIISGLLPCGTLPPSMAVGDPGYRPGGGTDPASADGEAPLQDGAAGSENEAEGDLPPLEGAGLIAEALPADGRSLQAAIERFLDRLTDLTPDESDPAAQSRGGPISVGMLGLLAMTLAARQRLRGKRPETSARRREDRDSEQSLDFPELPGSWSTRLT